MFSPELPLLARSVWMENDQIIILDETTLPERVEYLKVGNYKEAAKAIKEMKTRAFGQVLLCLYALVLTAERGAAQSKASLLSNLKEAAGHLERSRPTFPFKEFTRKVLGWAEEGGAQRLRERITQFVESINQRRKDRAKEASKLIKDGDTILTHCNVSGEMTMIAKACQIEGKEVKFIVTETRPYFQGSRLTCFELMEAGFPFTLIADNVVATVISQGMVNLVIVGSDRCAQNGDIANKIGTYQISLVAKEFGIPFYVLAQSPFSIPSGKLIPIEERDPEELLTYKGIRVQEGIKGYYPAFDITPSSCITKHILLGGEYPPFIAIPEDNKVDKNGKGILIHGVPEEAFYQKEGQRLRGKKIFVLEARPYLDGAKIVAARLKEMKFDPILVSDNMVGFLMEKGMIENAFLFYQNLDSQGAICQIGSLIIGICAKEHKIPIFLHRSSKHLPYMGETEDICYFNGFRVAPKGVKAYLPLQELVSWNYIGEIK